MNTITRLDEKTEQQIRTSFLEKIGVRIRTYREKKNISQDSLGKCLGLHGSMISRIENGTTDTTVSNIQLMSLYCDFPLNDLFIEDECTDFLNAFSKAVEITAKKYGRTKKQKHSDKMLKGKIYEQDGKEIIEPVPLKQEISETEMYRQGLVSTSTEPISETEFYDAYADNKNTISRVITAGKLLTQISDESDKDSIRNALAGYIIDELIIVKEPSDTQTERLQQRIYAYYKALLENHKK